MKKVLSYYEGGLYVYCYVDGEGSTARRLFVFMNYPSLPSIMRVWTFKDQNFSKKDVSLFLLAK